MDIKYKIYDVKNAGGEPDVFLGRASIQGFRQSNKTYFYWHYNKNIRDTFLFASITSSKNIKITPPSSTNPFVEFDTRFYNFYNKDAGPANLFSNTIGAGEVLSVYFRSITTDGSLFIKQSKKDKFLWNGLKFIEDTSITTGDGIGICTDGTIRVVVPDYQLVDNEVSEAAKLNAYSVIRDRNKNDLTNTMKLLMKNIVGSECIKVRTVNDRIKIDFDKVNCPCGNIIYLSSSSNSSESSSSSNSSSSSSSNSSSSSSNSSSSNSSSSSSLEKSQSSQSSSIAPIPPPCDFPICTVDVFFPKKATVINSNGVCIPNGIYNSTELNGCFASWANGDSIITVTKDQNNGDWVIIAENNGNFYEGILPPSGLSCDKGWIEGAAILYHTTDFSSSQSSSSQSLSSDSSQSSDSSSSSYIKSLYKKYFINCDGPSCSSEFYCVYEFIDEWICSDSLSESSTSSSNSNESSNSSNSSSSLSSESSNSSSSSSLTKCSPTILIIFG